MNGYRQKEGYAYARIDDYRKTYRTLPYIGDAHDDNSRFLISYFRTVECPLYTVLEHILQYISTPSFRRKQTLSNIPITKAYDVGRKQAHLTGQNFIGINITFPVSLSSTTLVSELAQNHSLYFFPIDETSTSPLPVLRAIWTLNLICRSFTSDGESCLPQRRSVSRDRASFSRTLL